MRKPQPYYRVDVLKDGTIVCAFPSRKPHKSQGRTMASGDPDGCHSFGVFDTDKDMDGFKDWARGLVFGAIANRLNLRKTLRSDVEPRLERIERKLEELTALIQSTQTNPAARP